MLYCDPAASRIKRTKPWLYFKRVKHKFIQIFNFSCCSMKPTIANGTKTNQTIYDGGGLCCLHLSIKSPILTNAISWIMTSWLNHPHNNLQISFFFQKSNLFSCSCFAFSYPNYKWVSSLFKRMQCVASIFWWKTKKKHFFSCSNQQSSSSLAKIFAKC